jgi:hypothetical protein
MKGVCGFASGRIPVTVSGDGAVLAGAETVPVTAGTVWGAVVDSAEPPPPPQPVAAASRRRNGASRRTSADASGGPGEGIASGFT